MMRSGTRDTCRCRSALLHATDSKQYVLMTGIQSTK
jgi:hypothetical protein